MTDIEEEGVARNEQRDPRFRDIDQAEARQVAELAQHAADGGFRGGELTPHVVLDENSDERDHGDQKQGAADHAPDRREASPRLRDLGHEQQEYGGLAAIVRVWQERRRAGRFTRQSSTSRLPPGILRASTELRLSASTR